MIATNTIFTSQNRRAICSIEPKGSTATHTVRVYGWRDTDAPVTTPPYELSKVELTPDQVAMLTDLLMRGGATRGDNSLLTRA